MNLQENPDLKKKRLETIVRKASNYVLDLLATSLDSKIVFHNQRHTVLTIHALHLIAQYEDLSMEDLYHLELAAWFQNTGYIKEARNPIVAASTFASNFMERNGFDAQSKEQVLLAIRDSEEPQLAEDTLAGVLHDAKWYFLAAANFREMLDRLRLEEAGSGNVLSDEGWMNQVANLVYNHEYLTSYGKDILESEKRKNYFRYRRINSADSFPYSRRKSNLEI